MKLSLIAAALLLSFAPTRAGGAEPTQAGKFVQDRFAIGLWVPPMTSENLPKHYQDLADANFSVVIGTEGTTPAIQLELCEKVGLRAIVRADGPADKLPDGPACWGYLLADEPGPTAFPDLAKRVAEIRAARPGKLGYVNLYPNYVPEWAIGEKYDEHVARFVREVKPDVLSMDHYPLMRPESDSRTDYCRNLETMRVQSQSAGIPFWNFFYSLPFNDRLDPTEAQLRWQIYASIAYGAKGVLYFCYWTPGKGAAGAGEFPKGGAIITAEGLKTRHYDEAKRINAEVKNLGPTLMQLTATGATRINTESAAATQPAGSALRKLTKVPGDPPGNFILGNFKHADGRRALLILNHSYSHTAWPTVELDADIKAVREVDKASGKEVAAVDDSPELKGFQVSLGAGDARLFLLPN